MTALPTGSGEGASLAAWYGRRERLLATLRSLAEMALTRSDQVSHDTLGEADQRLSEGRLTLAVLGEFKRGKSTLINSLLGAPVMPVGVIPMTSVPLRVEHGETPGAAVELESGGELSITLDQLSEYATETGNPGNRKGVVGVAVRHPAAILRQGVILVDSPGIGSIHAHNTKAAYEHLRHADAAIFVLSIDSPASQAELDFLAAAQEQVSRILFVLNKVDLLSPDELEQVTGFVLGVLREASGGKEVQLFAISARAKDSGYMNFEAALEHFLLEERGLFLLERAKAVALAAIRGERRAIALHRAALMLSSKEAENRAALLAERLSDVRRQRLEAEEILAGDMKRLVAAVLDPSIGRFRRSGTEMVGKAIQAELDAPAPDLRARLDRIPPVIVRELVTAWLGELERELEPTLAEVAERHSQRTNRLAQSAVQLVAEVFQTELEELSLSIHLAPASQRLVLVDDQLLALEVVSSALKRLAPGRLGSGLASRDALRRGEELIDRHCGRVRHDVLERLGAREAAWRLELRQALDGLELSVGRAGEMAASARSEGGAAVAKSLGELDFGERELEALAAGIGEDP
jgi:ribosome biogenesis GTPase A